MTTPSYNLAKDITQTIVKSKVKDLDTAIAALAIVKYCMLRNVEGK